MADTTEQMAGLPPPRPDQVGASIASGDGAEHYGASNAAGPAAGGAVGVAHAPHPTRPPSLDRDHAWIGGVSGAVAGVLHLPLIAVRGGWVVLTLVGGWGALLYLGAWIGLAIAEARGATTDYGPPPKRVPLVRWLGWGAIVIGLAMLLGGLRGLSPLGAWGVVVCGCGAVLERRALVGQPTSNTSGAPSRSTGPLRTTLLFGTGMLVVMAGAVMVAVSAVGAGPSSWMVIMIAVVAFVLASTTWPWWWGALSRMDRERQARVRADERAAVGAHLHDSVLQTLVLIQNEDDPQQMVYLARKQERELRNWLEGGRRSRDGAGVRHQLDLMASELESQYGVRVEVVVVGDAIVDEPIDALLAATRQALVNAAQHAQVATVDVFVEVMSERVDAFVRDRGVGFEPDTMPPRLGIRDSIMARLARVGGSATITSTPGEGTEVEMWVPVRST